MISLWLGPYNHYTKRSMDTIPMTVNGAKALEVELLRLKEEERPRIVSDIATAREHGDLKENAEYHAQRENQSHLHRKISELKSRLSRAQIVDPNQIPKADELGFR